MTESQDQLPDPPYGPEDLKRIAQKLGLSELPTDLEKSLRQAACSYRFLAEVERKPGLGDDWRAFLPTRKELRKALEKVAKEARRLQEALQDRALMFLDDSSDLPLAVPNELDELAETADRLAREVPRGGANPKEARRAFVRRLARIFQDATGKPPKRQFSLKTELDSGPFLEFVQAALRPLDPGALKGVEHVVREVCDEVNAINQG